MASLIGEVRGTILLRARSGPIFEMTVGITPPPADSDEAMQGLLTAPSGLILETVKCLWFHGTYLKDKFYAGQRLALYGKLEGSRTGNALNAPAGSTKFKMIQPTFEILPDPQATGEDAEFTMLEMGRIVPIYESLGGKTPGAPSSPPAGTAEFSGPSSATSQKPQSRVKPFLTPSLQRLGLPTRLDAFQHIHFPRRRHLPRRPPDRSHPRPPPPHL